MISSVHAAAQAIPGYCTSGHGVLTPAQWTTCAKLGWHQSTTGAATAGASVGHYAAPLIAIVVIVMLLAAMSKRRSPATSRS